MSDVDHRLSLVALFAKLDLSRGADISACGKRGRSVWHGSVPIRMRMGRPRSAPARLGVSASARIANGRLRPIHAFLPATAAILLAAGGMRRKAGKIACGSFWAGPIAITMAVCANLPAPPI